MEKSQDRQVLTMCILGDHDVGKTAIIQHFMGGDLKQKSKTSTTDIKHYQKRIGQKIFLQMIDTPGKSNYISTIYRLIRQQQDPFDIVVYVFSLCNTQSLFRLRNYKQLLKSLQPSARTIVIGHKCDQTASVATKKAIDMAKQIKANAYYETSINKVTIKDKLEIPNKNTIQETFKDIINDTIQTLNNKKVQFKENPYIKPIIQKQVQRQNQLKNKQRVSIHNNQLNEENPSIEQQSLETSNPRINSKKIQQKKQMDKAFNRIQPTKNFTKKQTITQQKKTENQTYFNSTQQKSATIIQQNYVPMDYHDFNKKHNDQVMKKKTTQTKFQAGRRGYSANSKQRALDTQAYKNLQPNKNTYDQYERLYSQQFIQKQRLELQKMSLQKHKHNQQQKKQEKKTTQTKFQAGRRTNSIDNKRKALNTKAYGITGGKKYAYLS